MRTLVCVVLLTLLGCKKSEPAAPSKAPAPWLTGFDADATRRRLQGSWKGSSCTFIFSGDSFTTECEGEETVRETFAIPLPGRLKVKSESGMWLEYGFAFVGEDELHFGLGVSGEVLPSGVVIPTFEVRGVVVATPDGCTWHRVYDADTINVPRDEPKRVPCTFSRESGAEVLRYDEPGLGAPTPREVTIVGSAAMSPVVASNTLKRVR